jgi:Fic family protein
MKPDQYQVTPFGRVAWDRLGSWDYPYFLPAPIVDYLELDLATLEIVTSAERELGRLSGAVTSAKDFELLSGTGSLIESLASSQIEGTQSTLDEVLSNEIPMSEIQSPDLREVFNHQSANELGLGLLRELPLSQRLFLRLQKELLSDVRGAERTPGEIRRSPVWVGGSGPENSTYIPPLPHHLPELLADWEKFVNSAPKQLVVWLALSHYQFETIHPLLDGNGRVGRILIELQLVQSGLLPRPALGISGYFERNRTEYYQRLQAVRESGEMMNWISFFANGVYEQARRSRELLVKLVALKEEYLGLLPERSELVVTLIKNPLPTVTRIMTELSVSQPTASKYLALATNAGITKSLGKSGRGNKERWVVTKTWLAIQAHQNA